MSINQKPPSGILLFLFRLPIHLFRMGLGPIFGRRFLMLSHTGRKSGQSYQTVIEVVRYELQTNTYYVASAWGRSADWFRNLLTHPDTIIQVKNQQINVTARQLSEEESGEELLRYSHTYPFAFRELMHLMGYKDIHTDQEIRNLGKIIPIVAFMPL